MSWATLVLAGLKMVSAMLTYLNDRKLIQAGEDKIIAAASLELLGRTAEGKRLREHVRSLSDKEEDDLWERMLKQ
jgi:hypothetical protein